MLFTLPASEATIAAVKRRERQVLLNQCGSKLSNGGIGFIVHRRLQREPFCIIPANEKRSLLIQV